MNFKNELIELFDYCTLLESHEQNIMKGNFWVATLEDWEKFKNNVKSLKHGYNYILDNMEDSEHLE